jgi:hypothetical protein
MFYSTLKLEFKFKTTNLSYSRKLIKWILGLSAHMITTLQCSLYCLNYFNARLHFNSVVVPIEYSIGVGEVKITE